MDDRQAHRIARNEDRFRTLNEQQVAAEDAIVGPRSSFEAICECALADCETMIEVDRGHYEKARSHPTWFLVAPRHIVDEVERPVETAEGYWIIEKLGASGAKARELDEEAHGS